MKLEPFSQKQLEALTWWMPGSSHFGRDAILCDGAVRSGKTLCMSLSFVSWASAVFTDTALAMCGKTILSLRRNVVTPLLPLLAKLGFWVEDRPSKHELDIGRDGRRNRFYLFGGQNEASASHIQGVTLGGVLFDEAALMPRSFVEQALARCSLPGSRFWFNCNPEHPHHWLYREWIEQAEAKNALRLHFTMEDNPSLSPAVRARYESMYTGRFYDRYVRGLWVRAEGLVYPHFSDELVFDGPPPACSRWRASCDYGTVNPTSIGLWGESGGAWYRAAEYYYDSRRENGPRTDEEHYAALCALVGDRELEYVVADPSAASFLTCIRKHGRFPAIPAKNDVPDGIRRVSEALRQGRLRFSRSCADTLREFSLYSYPEGGGEQPCKKNDHAMDDIRYFAATLDEGPGGDFYAESLARPGATAELR